MDKCNILQLQSKSTVESTHWANGCNTPKCIEGTRSIPAKSMAFCNFMDFTHETFFPSLR